MFRPEIIYIDREARELETTRNILERTRHIRHVFVDAQTFERDVSNFTLTEGKRIVFITRSRGDRVKACPGTQAPYLCCRYTVIDVITQCPLDCSYCILQTYLDNPLITLYANLDDIADGMQKRMRSEPGRYFRFGTGELSDSLALESLTGVSQTLANALGPSSSGLLEFKTKTGAIDGLLGLKQSNIVCSWSLNPECIVRTEEAGTAPLEARLRAAERCADHGRLLGFHFDPLLHFRGWEDAYRGLIEMLFERIDAERIVWVSLGTLRYPPHLRSVVERRHPGRPIFTEEMIRGQDGKMRYPRLLRTEIYKRIAGELLTRAPDLFIYFCMEPPSVWDAVLGRCASVWQVLLLLLHPH